MQEISEAVCLASGPSLTPADVDLVRRWRAQSQDRAVIVVNSTFRAAPWADALYAMDRKWWMVHLDEVRDGFKGRACAPMGGLRGVERVDIDRGNNSGCGAISLAASRGAKCVYLLGYDCQHTDGKKHWHGDHPKGLGNAGRVAAWPAQFARLARKLRGVQIINCSRVTALDCFERVSPEFALGDGVEPIVIPPQCLPLLREQRTHYANLETEYGAELAATFAQIEPHVAGPVRRVLDIGCGMAGIDVFIGRRWPDAELHLLDKQGVAARINAGFSERVEDFAHYHDFDGARAMLEANGVRNWLVMHDMHRDPFPGEEFDLVVSLLSWGFHYPIETYAPRCRGVMVVDVRRDTGGEQALAKYGDVSVLHEARKFRRVLVRC